VRSLDPFKIFCDRTTDSRKTVECEPHRHLKLWIYDLRTNKHFTLKENPLKRSDLDDFVNCYFGRGDSPNRPRAVEVNRPYLSRHGRTESERFKSFAYEELTKRDP
jgi:type I restriction enzyme M protein